MSDIRAAAQREADKRWPKPVAVDHDPMPYDERKYERGIFVDGAVWAADRVTPTRDDVADALAGAYDEWCVLLKEFLAGRGADPGSEYEYKADPVLALLRSNAL